MNELQSGKKRVADVQAALARDREFKKPRPNQRMAEDVPDSARYSFWCDECDKDFNADAHKESHHIFEDLIITYRAECECGRECVRLISHRDLDPYYHLSEMIREERNRYRNDVLRHDEYGFETLYGRQHFKEHEDNQKAREERKLGLERQRGFKLSRPI
uniref:Uncharacterized protein n=1 Tax=viral metagenome TaxID=1070528 RepID=A0A6M3IMZ5_9ZZZZ